MRPAGIMLGVIALSAIAFVTYSSSEHRNIGSLADRADADSAHVSVRNPRSDSGSKTEPAAPTSAFVAGGMMGSGGPFGFSGALICPNYDTVLLLIRLRNEARNAAMADRASGGLQTILHGSPPSEPQPEAFGCNLIATGEPFLSVQGRSTVFVVTAKLGNGEVVRGVTSAYMMEYSAEEQQRQQVLADRTEQQRRRVQEIMKPEQQRFDAALKQESARYELAMQRLPLDAEAQRLKEVARHDAAVEQEQQKYNAALKAAEQEQEAALLSKP